MREDVFELPAAEIEPRPRRQEIETGLRKFGAPLAREHRVEALAQRVQVQDVGSGISELRFIELLRAPVARLLLLRQIDVEQFADQILQPVPIGVSA